jgi:hypothetical protein
MKVQRQVTESVNGSERGRVEVVHCCPFNLTSTHSVLRLPTLRPSRDSFQRLQIHTAPQHS